MGFALGLANNIMGFGQSGERRDEHDEPPPVRFPKRLDDQVAGPRIETMPAEQSEVLLQLLSDAMVVMHNDREKALTRLGRP